MRVRERERGLTWSKVASLDKMETKMRERMRQ